MVILIQIFLLILNLTFGFINISNNASPYIIAVNFFAAGFVAMAVIATAANQ